MLILQQKLFFKHIKHTLMLFIFAKTDRVYNVVFIFSFLMCIEEVSKLVTLFCNWPFTSFYDSTS